MRITSYQEYQEKYKQSIENPEKFWGGVAENFQWQKKWDTVLKSDFRAAKTTWFEGAKLNITENCLDRHLEKRGNQTAIIWEPNDPKEEAIHLTYKELHQKVAQFANALKNNGAKKGDRICIYMPMVPELAIALLACARIGAVHSVVFAGFSSTALASRINDATCSILLTADGSFRGSKQIDLKKIADKALRFPQVVSMDGYDEIKNFHQFDNIYTAPLHGFTDAQDYWAKCSGRNALPYLKKPTLIVNAADDPFLSGSCYDCNLSSRSTHLFMETPNSGGHVGFARWKLNSELWSEHRALAFANSLLEPTL